MDDLDQRILDHVRPIREVVAIALAELDDLLPGLLARVDAKVEAPNRELVMQTDDERADLSRMRTVIRLARQFRGTIQASDPGSDPAGRERP